MCGWEKVAVLLVTVHAALLLRLHTTSKSSSVEWTQDKVAVGVDRLEAALFHVKSSESRLNDVLSHIDKILCNNFFFFFLVCPAATAAKSLQSCPAL